MKLELALLAGAESKQFLVDFTKQIDRLEKLAGKGTVTMTARSATAAPVETEYTDTDDDFDNAAKPEVETAATDDDDDDDFGTTPVKAAPKAKAKKVTIDDVNNACKARAKGGRREEVLKLLKKNFKTESIAQIPEKSWARAIELMEE